MLIWRLQVSITTFLVVLWDVFKCLQSGFYKNNKITNVQKNKKKVVKKKNEEIKDGCNLCFCKDRKVERGPCGFFLHFFLLVNPSGV